MARFVSRHRNFRLTVRNEVSEPTATGVRVLVRPLHCHWHDLGLTDYEVEQGLARLVFTGLPEDRDTGQAVSARQRLSILDTREEQTLQGWTDEEHDLVVEGLLSNPELGRGYIAVEPPPLTAPWPTYDQLDDADQILRLTLLTGVKPDEVIAYERQNKQRPEVIHALEHIDDPDVLDAPAAVPDDEVVIQA